MQRAITASRQFLASKPLRTVTPVRRMGGGGDDHHHHQVFDMSSDFNPFGTPLVILVTVVGGGLGIAKFAVNHSMSQFKSS